MSYADLIERLEKLEVPDRETDFWLSVRVFDPSNETDEALRADIDLVGIEGMVIDAPFTASLDAAVALVGRVLPGWFWRVGRTSLFPNGWAYISKTHPSHCDREDEASCSDGRAATPAIALLIATLKALDQQHD